MSDTNDEKKTLMKPEDAERIIKANEGKDNDGFPERALNAAKRNVEEEKKIPMTPEDAERIIKANKGKDGNDGFPERAMKAAKKNVEEGKVPPKEED